MVHSLNRKTFMTSRLAEFCTQSELVRLTGHAVDYWPRYILKELVDNALDAAEEAGTAPVIKINASNGIITVDDNGPGIPAETVTSSLDYGTRTSSRAAYVAPTRGAQGNALQTILAMPYVLAGGEDNALTIIESRGVKHSISFSQDPVSQEPCIELPKSRQTSSPPERASRSRCRKRSLAATRPLSVWRGPTIGSTRIWTSASRQARTRTRGRPETPHGASGDPAIPHARTGTTAPG